MTKTVSINNVQNELPGLLAMAREGDEIVIEENGEPLAKVTAIDKPTKQKPRTAGLGSTRFAGNLAGAIKQIFGTDTEVYHISR